MCPATFDLAAVRALGGPSARVDLERLVDAALVVPVEPGPGERRFRLSDPTRTYAGSLLDDDERQEAVRRHAEHYRELLVRAGREMVGERDREWIRRLERDDANVRSALDWWIDHEPAGALGFADGLGRATQFGTQDRRVVLRCSTACSTRRCPTIAATRIPSMWPTFGSAEDGLGS